MSSSIRAVVIDDEPLARKRLRTLLADEPRIQVLGEAGTGSSAIELIERTKPDLVFLDIQMPGLSGFDVLQQLELEKLPLVIFVTAFDEHALRAFEVNALDYLLKPVTEPRFRAAVARALERVAASDGGLSRDVLAALARMGREGADRIPIKSANGVTFVRVHDVDWAEVEGDYVRLHVGKDTHLLRETMSQLEQRLPESDFIRIHRSTMVNLERVAQVQPWLKGDYVLILRDGTRLISGRTYRERVQRLLR